MNNQNQLIEICYNQMTTPSQREANSDWDYDMKCTYVMNALNGQCVYKAVQKALTDQYTRYFATMFNQGEFDELFPMLKQTRERVDEIIDGKENPLWWLITVNCDYNRVPFPAFKKAVEKMVTKKWIEEYYYVYEQRGEDTVDKPIGHGYHVHCLIKRNDSKTRGSEIEREIQNTASKVCDAKNPQICNFRRLLKPKDVEHAWKYINGQKDVDDDKSYKMPALQCNPIWRSSNGLLELYKSHEHPSLLVRDASPEDST